MPPAETTAEKQERGAHLRQFQFKPGQSGNPSGRPPGSISIKDKVRQYLEDNPESVREMVETFVKKRPELVWQMLEGKPGQKLEHGGPNETPLFPETGVIRDIAERLNGLLGTGGVGSDGDAARPLDTQAPDKDQ